MGGAEIASRLFTGVTIMTAAASPEDDDYGSTETESHDSVLVEFTDAAIEFTRRPVRETVLRNLPSWLRDGARIRSSASAGVGLAICLCDQARLHLRAGRFAEALPRLLEAQQILEAADDAFGLVDCLHLISQTHAGLGDAEQSMAALRREEELRRQLAA